MHLIFRTEDEDLDVVVRPDGPDWQLTVAGQEVPLQAARDREGVWLVETHQGRRRLQVAVRGDERLVFCDGKVHTLRLLDAEHAADEDQPTVGPDLRADMPGKVVQVLVTEGQEVAAGQTVLIMESMKMETEMVAAMSGSVAAIHVAAGQVVGQGEALVDITPSA